MTGEDIKQFARQRPFRPFRITLTDGTTYDVHHPDLAMVGYSTVIVGVPRPSGASDMHDLAVTVSVSHVTKIEPLEMPASRDSTS